MYFFSLLFQKENKKQSSMDEVFLRFPHLSETIFDSLNSESLAKSKEVCRSWDEYLDDQNFLHTRADKVKEVIETVEKLGQIPERVIPIVSITVKNTFDLETRKTIINGARNGNFGLVHTKIMKNISFMYDEQPFLIATVLGHFEIVKYLVDNLEEKNPIVSSYAGLTPLHIASIHGGIDAVKYIMSNVLDINPTDKTGETPLHYAAHGNTLNINGNKLEVVQYIMKKLVNNSPKNNAGRTPLHVAAANGQLIIFKYIIENVVEKNLKDNYGNTPIDLAREGKYWEIVTVASKYLDTE